MVFNQSNVDNRLRQPVRGRVIVFTTSTIVEYLSNDLRLSFPLFNFPNIPKGKGATFVVEVDGFLTFDKDVFVKIEELAPFNAFDYDPTQFAILQPAEDFKATIVEAKPWNVYDTYSTEVDDYIKVAAQLSVVYYSAPGVTARDTYKVLPTALPVDRVQELCHQLFTAGTEYVPGEGEARSEGKLQYLGIDNN